MRRVWCDFCNTELHEDNKYSIEIVLFNRDQQVEESIELDLCGNCWDLLSLFLETRDIRGKIMNMLRSILEKREKKKERR